ncbi:MULTISPECIES: hypothetical protein [unclassified Nonomuraea]|uniref:hypothetical protein n=1 Tax=unclassified Nonomuraea TaxID=2593643 RepID=UPI0033ECC2BC
MTAPSGDVPSAGDPPDAPPGDPPDASGAAQGGSTQDGSAADSKLGYWFVGGLLGWLLLGPPFVIGLVGSFAGVDMKAPAGEALLDRFYWWVALGVPGVIAAVGGSFWGVTTLLTRRRERAARRELILTERVERLQDMVREAQAVSRDLELYLQERLAALQRLSAQVDSAERLAALTPEQVKALDDVLRRQFVGQGRRGFVTQVVFFLLGIMIAFIVNWLSNPMLALVQKWLH